MARRFLVAAVLLLVGLAGCVDQATTRPGPPNPQVILYDTEDNMTQLVVRGAFKTIQFDRVEVQVLNATTLDDHHVYVATTKFNATSFDLSVRVTLDGTTYAYDGLFTRLGAGLEVTEFDGDELGDPFDADFPFTRIIEKASPQTSNLGAMP